MPIISVQRRMAEHGRIRLGNKVTGVSRSGREYTRPAKLDRFRFTSAAKRLIDQIADVYGGTPQPWDNDGKAEWEVVSDATSLPVIVVKGGFSQWHEHWTKGGLQHRCDGEKDAAGTFCDPEDPAHQAAIEKPTTRLSVMLSEIESLGVWRMESHGWNAAAELPSMAELAIHVGDLVPATLGLAERSAIIQTEKGPQTSRFVVPYLDLHVTKQRLVEIVGGPGGTPTAAVAAPSGAAELESPKPAAPDYRAIADTLLDVDSLRDLWKQADEAGHLDDGLREYLTATSVAIKERDQQQAEGSEPDKDGVVDAEVVEDDEPPAVDGDTAPDPSSSANPDDLWAEIVRVAGGQGMSLPDLEDDFAGRMGGVTSADATAAELGMYLDHLRKSEAVPA